jgi:hypothetical protein
MNGPVPFAEAATVAFGEERLHLGDNGQGNFFRSFSADVETDGRVDARHVHAGGHRRGVELARRGNIAEHGVGAVTGSEDADVGGAGAEEKTDGLDVPGVVVVHHDGGGAAASGGEGVTAQLDNVGPGESSLHSGIGVLGDDGDLPAEAGREPADGESIVTTAEKEQVDGGGYDLKKDVGSRAVAFDGGEPRAQLGEGSGSFRRQFAGFGESLALGQEQGAVGKSEPRGSFGGNNRGHEDGLARFATAIGNFKIRWSQSRADTFEQNSDTSTAAKGGGRAGAVVEAGLVGNDSGAIGGEEQGPATGFILQAPAADRADAASR